MFGFISTVRTFDLALFHSPIIETKYASISYKFVVFVQKGNPLENKLCINLPSPSEFLGL